MGPKKCQQQESRKIIFLFKKIKKTDFRDNFILFVTPFWPYFLNHLSYRSETFTQNRRRWVLQKMSTVGISQNNFYKDFQIISPNSLKMRGVPLNLSKKGLMTKWQYIQSNFVWSEFIEKRGMGFHPLGHQTIQTVMDVRL